MAEEGGIATPTIDDLIGLNRKRTGKKLSNEDWTSPTDPDAEIARMKDGTTHLAASHGDIRVKALNSAAHEENSTAASVSKV
jgi:hypothetical protein